MAVPTLWSVAFLCSAHAAGRADSADAEPAPGLQLNAYIVDGNSLLKPVEIEIAVYPYLGPGRSVDDIGAARDALEALYQKRGYQSVVVEIPEQQVRGGIVRLRVVETRVGRVRVEGARWYSPRVLRESMPALAEGGIPDFTLVQQELTAANRLPGRQVTPLLAPGTAPGTVDVVLKVNDEAPLHGSAELHNDHSQNTEDLRASATLRYDNLWQRGHSIAFTYLVAPEDADSATVYSGSYLAPLWGTPWNLLLFGYDSDSSVATLGGTTVLGRGSALGLRAIRQLPEVGEQYSHSLSLGLDYKKSEEDIVLGGARVSSPIEYWPLNLAYNGQHAGERAVSGFGSTLILGLRGPGSDADEFANKRAFAAGNFAVLRLEGSQTRTLPQGFELSLRGTAQVADQSLVSTEQLSAGGASSVRGYLQSEAIGDRGAQATLELGSPSFAGAVGWKALRDWRVLAFADAAHAALQDALPDQDDDIALAGAGLGTRLALYGWLYGDVDYAWALIDGTASAAGEQRLHFRLRGEF